MSEEQIETETVEVAETAEAAVEVTETEEITEPVETPSTPPPTPTSINDLQPKMKLNGVVSRLELYGAFIDVGIGANALVHISQLGKTHVNRVADVLKIGDEVNVWVLKTDPKRNQIMVTMIEPMAVEWSDLKEGQAYNGKITRLETYGVFVNIGAEREGLVHISELSHNFVKQPSEIYSPGDEVQVKVLGFSKRKRRIDLSIKALQEKPEITESIETALDGGGQRGPKKNRRRNKGRREEKIDYEAYEAENETLPTAMEVALRNAMGNEAVDAIATPTKKKGRKRYRKESLRSKQEDIMSRTLNMQHDGA